MYLVINRDKSDAILEPTSIQMVGSQNRIRYTQNEIHLPHDITGNGSYS